MVALVITVIVIIILTSVSLSSIRGKKGLIKQANDSNSQVEDAGEKKAVLQAISESLVFAKNGELHASDVQNALNTLVGVNKTTVSETSDEIQVTFVDSQRVYNINKDGTLSN